MSQSHAKRGTDSPQTQHKKRRVNKQNSLTQYGLTGSGTRLLESHGIFTDLYQAIVRMHQTLIFFFLNYPFTAWGVAASRAQHLAKSFTPSSIPTIPARMKTHITADSKKTDTAARRPTPPPEDTTPTPKEIDTSDSEKTDTATRRHHRRHRGDRRHRIREERRHQKNNHHYPRNAESILYQTLPPPTPPPSKQKQKQKQIQSNFFITSKHQQRNYFSFSTPFPFFFNSFSKQRSDHWATQVPLHPTPQKHIVPQYPI